MGFQLPNPQLVLKIAGFLEIRQVRSNLNLKRSSQPSIRNKNQPQRPPNPPSNKGLIAGLIKGNQWLINPDHKAGYFLGVNVALGGA